MIVVTGGAGFIGSVLIWKLNTLGREDILVVDQNAENTPRWNNLKSLRFSRYLDSQEFIRRLEAGDFEKEITAIFHLGACSDTTEMDKSFLRANNSGYSERIARWCMNKRVYLSYASSAAVYGNGELGFSDDDWKTPSMKPLNPYGQSKLDFDTWLLKNGHEKSVVGFRFFNVYGPNEYHKGSMRSMVQKGFEQVLAHSKIKLFKSYKPEYADGGQLRDFIYVKDVVDVLLWFHQNQNIKGIFNLGTGKAQSWNDLAEAIFKACKKPKVIEYIDMPESIRNQYQYFTEANLDKLKKTGCPTRFQNLDSGVSDYIQHHLSQPNPYI